MRTNVSILTFFPGVAVRVAPLLAEHPPCKGNAQLRQIPNGRKEKIVSNKRANQFFCARGWTKTLTWDLHEARVLLGAAAAARRRPVAGEHPVPSSLACSGGKSSRVPHGRIGRRSERQRDCGGCPGRWLWLR